MTVVHARIVCLCACFYVLGWTCNDYNDGVYDTVIHDSLCSLSSSPVDLGRGPELGLVDVPKHALRIVGICCLDRFLVLQQFQRHDLPIILGMESGSQISQIQSFARVL